MKLKESPSVVALPQVDLALGVGSTEGFEGADEGAIGFEHLDH